MVLDSEKFKKPGVTNAVMVGGHAARPAKTKKKKRPSLLILKKGRK